MKLEKITQERLDSKNLMELIGKLPIHYFQEEERKGGLYRVITFEAEIIGFVLISSEKECTIGILHQYRNKGFGTKALTELAREAFEKNKFEKITAKTQIGRASSGLTSKFKLKEVARTNEEIFYEFTKEMWAESKKT